MLTDCFATHIKRKCCLLQSQNYLILRKSSYINTLIQQRLIIRAEVIRMLSVLGIKIAANLGETKTQV